MHKPKTKTYLCSSIILLASILTFAETPSQTTSTKQSFIDALSQYWGKPTPSVQANNPPPSPATTTIFNGSTSSGNTGSALSQSLMSFTGQGESSAFDLAKVPSVSGDSIANFLCLTSNSMPDSVNQPSNSILAMMAMINSAITSPGYAFSTIEACNNSAISADAKKIANAYRAVKFFHLLSKQCLATYGDPNADSSSAKKASSDPLAATNNQAPFSKNLKACSQFNILQLMLSAHNTLFANEASCQSLSSSKKSSELSGQIPTALLSNFGLNDNNALGLANIALTPNSLTLCPLATSKKTYTANFKATFKSAITNVNKTLDDLEHKLATALMIQLNQDGARMASSKKHALGPYSYSTASLVSQTLLNSNDMLNTNQWLKGISEGFSPKHYVAPNFIFSNTKDVYAIGQGQLLNLSSLDSQKDLQKAHFVKQKGDSNYVAPSSVQSYRSSQQQSINNAIQKYTKDVAQVGFLKNAALGSLAMIIGERKQDNNKSSFIEKLKTNATSRSGDTYKATLAKLKPVDLMREEVKLLADIRYQLFLNYMAQERVQAAIALVQLTNMNNSIAKVNAQYSSIQKKIKAFNEGGGGSSLSHAIPSV